jgi:hypothetical protein
MWNGVKVVDGPGAFFSAVVVMNFFSAKAIFFHYYPLIINSSFYNY